MDILCNSCPWKICTSSTLLQWWSRHNLCSLCIVCIIFFIGLHCWCLAINFDPTLNFNQKKLLWRFAFDHIFVEEWRKSTRTAPSPSRCPVEGMALITALLCPDAGRPNLMLGPTWLKARFENSCSQVPNLIFNGQDQIESLKSQLWWLDHPRFAICEHFQSPVLQ